MRSTRSEWYRDGHDESSVPQLPENEIRMSDRDRDRNLIITDLPMISRSRLAASRPRSGELAMGLARTHSTDTNPSHHTVRRRRTTARQISQTVFTFVQSSVLISHKSLWKKFHCSSIFNFHWIRPPFVRRFLNSGWYLYSS